VLVLIALNVVGTGIDRGFHERVLVDGIGRDVDFTLAVELIRNTALSCHTTAVFGENRADIGSGAVEIVGCHFHDECDAGGAVAFVGNFLDGVATEFAGAFFDGTVDVVLGHGDGLGIVDCGAETGISGWISATSTGGECDFM